MKKIVGCVLCLAMLLCISACGYNPSDNTNSTNVNNNSSELSDKEKYDNAIAFFTEKKYKEAIGILENIDYENSKDLKKSISYVYACELFNKQEFSTAYDYFEKSEDYLDSQKNLNMSAYYEGVKLVNNNQQGRSIDWFRKTLGDIEYSSLSKQHIITITTSLISSGWIGTYYDDGATAQIEFKYFKNNNNLYVGWADKSDGYRFLSSLEGPLSIGAEYCTFSPKRLNESMKFKISFDSNDDMYIYSDNETTRQLMGGSYTSKGTCLYEIAIENYPVLTVPEIDINGNIKNSNISDESVSASSTESSVSKVNENSATSTNTNSSNNDNKGTNSKPDNSSNNTDKKPSNNTNSGSANNTNTSSKPTTTHTHSYSKATCTKPATCSCGATSGSALGHSWKNASCKTPKTCSTCGVTEGVKANHSYKNEKCTLCGEKSANYPKASDIKLQYPNKLVYESEFKVLSYSISNMDGYYEGKAKISIKMQIVDIRNNNDHSEYFGVKYYDSNGNDITKWKPYDSQYITSGSVLMHLETGDVCTSEFEIPVNCRKIVLISIR